MTDPREKQDWEDELFNIRSNEQKQKQDYSYDDYGSIERCDACGSSIDSHGHCPRCDYY